MNKKFFTFIIILLLFPFLNVHAKKVTVYVFTKQNESISTDTIKYFKQLKESDIRDYFDYKEYVIWDANWHESKYYRNLADKVAKKFDKEVLGAPIIVISDNYYLEEFYDDLKIEIRNEIIKAYEDKKYHDIVKEIEKNLLKKSKKDTIIIVSIGLGIILIIGIFIYLSRKKSK